ncbi:TetR family transcriptional regulator [Nocardia sp. SYP-A9097]|uniref:TetR/AcrR family transcriptional regulator n=1 Tax=Nocardia sp. SYP-A9097 TaxID=2663237 RepID=UPI00129A7ECC|nr:TetR/AcrR family transcriptional regulator [Nocardia sp. SYP-A9097]MRH86266.1 TetR family transcriptional regulator [Nocardia sp. SYP-A9097]
MLVTTPRDPAGTRNRILDALETLLLDKGMSQVTLESVAAAAGVSKGGLLYHFKSKDALLAGLVRRVGERADQQLNKALAKGESVAEWYLQTPHPDNDSDAIELAMYRSMLAAMRTVDGPQDAPVDESDRALDEMMSGWKAALDNEIHDPVKAEIVRLVGDGVYLRALLGQPPVEPELYRRIVTRVLGDAPPPRDRDN